MGRITITRLREQERDEIKVKKTLRKSLEWNWPRIDEVPKHWLNTIDSVLECMTASSEPQQTLKQTHYGLHKELHTYYLNLTKQTPLKAIDLSPVYQLCIKF